MHPGQSKAHCVRQPQTRYARRGELSIAYQVVGSSGPWVVYVPGFMSHLDLQWTDLGFSRFLSRLASFTRLVLFDKPGTGLSDPISHVPMLEEGCPPSSSIEPGISFPLRVDATLRKGYRELGSSSFPATTTPFGRGTTTTSSTRFRSF